MVKRFFVTFSAVLAAIIVTVGSIALVGALSQWHNRRDGWLTQLALDEKKLAQRTREADQHLDQDPVEVAAVEVARTKLGLVRCYESKPWFLSGEERKRVKQWQDNVTAFNGRGQKSAHEPLSVEDFPTSLPEHPKIEPPPYPYEIRAKHLTGSGYALASFDEMGRCTNVVMTISTGSGLLDANTITFGLANWIGRPNSSVNVPITYKLN